MYIYMYIYGQPAGRAGGRARDSWGLIEYVAAFVYSLLVLCLFHITTKANFPEFWHEYIRG